LDALLGETLDELLSVHGRHDHVGEEDVDVAAPTSAELERFEAVGRLEHVVRVELERLADEPADDVFVVDDEDCSRRSLRGVVLRRRSREFGRRGGFDVREVNRERGTGAGRAFDVDLAARLLHDPVDGCQAETAAVAVLGGEEGFERVRTDILGHAGSGVSDASVV
jgi:hypothetical protein